MTSTTDFTISQIFKGDESPEPFIVFDGQTRNSHKQWSLNQYNIPLTVAIQILEKSGHNTLARSLEKKVLSAYPQSKDYIKNAEELKPSPRLAPRDWELMHLPIDFTLIHHDSTYPFEAILKKIDTDA